MKRALFQFFNLLMACVVLLSSTGFGLVEHSCQMRGKKKTVIGAFSDVKPQTGCAADGQSMPSKGPAIKKTECCQDEHLYENVDATSSLTQLVAKFVKTVTEAVLAGVTALLAWVVDRVFTNETRLSSAAFPSPPSLSGRDIITLVRSLLI